MNTRELMDKMAENLSVRRSFGAAYEREGLLIIPVALVAGGGGGGEGPIKPQATGRVAIGTAEPASSTPSDAQPPLGTGGGFGGVVLPVGVYVVKGDQVRWVPAFDATLIALGSLGVVRVFLSLLKNARRRAHAR